MDTKSRKSKPFKVWVCFFLAVSIITSLLINAFVALIDSDRNWEVLKAPFIDYHHSTVFRERTAYYYTQLILLAADPHDASRVEMTKRLLGNEGENIKYCVVNKDEGPSPVTLWPPFFPPVFRINK